MKEISFKMRKNYEQSRKFCVVKVETLIIDQSTGKKRSEMIKCQKVNDSYFNKKYKLVSITVRRKKYYSNL